MNLSHCEIIYVLCIIIHTNKDNNIENGAWLEDLEVETLTLYVKVSDIFNIFKIKLSPKSAQI